ncbi:hypothetical protein HY358_00370 [Candidatus Roizmanbacteria bacterium]|nr:hypothetical protein [Candidatus Roizmanbacteria bacterium]
MSLTVTHAALIILTIGAAFLLKQTPLGIYDVQISAFFIIASLLIKKFTNVSSVYLLVESVIISFVVTIIILSTGSLASPLFFLTYFLLFALSLLLEPIIPISATGAYVTLFFLFNPPTEPNHFFSLLSLLLLTPFALFLGRTQSNIRNLEESTFFFLSLVLKNHVKNIKSTADNFLGDHDLDVIKKQAKRMEKLIEEYEKSI